MKTPGTDGNKWSAFRPRFLAKAVLCQAWHRPFDLTETFSLRLLRNVAALAFLLLPVSMKAQFNTNQLMQTGRIALQYEDYVLSIQYFNRVISARPYLYEPWQLRAVAKFYLDDFVGAENDASKAIELNPYIDHLFDLRGISRIRLKNFQGAIDDYSRAIELNPSVEGYWYNRALCYFQLKDYDHALAQTDTIVKRWQKSAGTYSLKAEIYLQKKDTTEAALWLDKSLEVDPYDADAWTTRAYMAMNKRQWKDADHFFSEAIRLKPTDVNSYVNRALCRINTNNLRGVMADYDKAIELDPNNFRAHYNRGLIRVQLGDDNRAVEDFDFVVRMEPSNFMAIYNRAQLLDRIGDLRGAIRDYTTVINQFPNFWTGLEQRAWCYRRLGMTAKAEMDEFRVFKAQMNKHIGLQQRWSKAKLRSVRKRSEINLDKYNQIVVEDEPVVEREYKSSYRGHVQNRRVEMDMMPMYMLSFTAYSNGVQRYQAFDRDVERYNSSMSPLHKLYVNCSTQTLDSVRIQSMFSLVDTLSARIEGTSTVRNLTGKGQSVLLSLLMQRGVAYASIQNYDAAAADMTTYLGIDSMLSLAWWQRAVCQSLYASSVGQGDMAQLKAAQVKDDFGHAIRLNPQNAYLYYDRANFFARQQDYAHAIDDYTRAIEIDGHLAEAYYNRGVTRIMANDKKSGIADLSKAGELGLYEAYSVIKRYSK